jgi:hypothetical protein
LCERVRIAPIDTYQIFNGQIIGEWVGRLGWLPLLLVIGTIILTFRKTAFWVSMLNLLGTIVGLVLVIGIAVVAVAASSPTKEHPFAASGADRTEFVNKASAGCFSKQRAREQNRNVADEEITQLRQCGGGCNHAGRRSIPG